MKILLFLFIATSVIGAPAVYAEEENIVLDKKDIKLERKKVPGAATEGEEAVKEYGEDWWAIDFVFSTELELTEEITFKVYLTGYDQLDEDKPVILTGEVTFINILEGKEHRGTFYLHPGAAERYSGLDYGIESFGRDSGGYNVRVEIFEKGAFIEGIDLEDDDPNWHTQGTPLSDVLIGVKDSPWWPFEALSYSQIKDER